MLVRPTTCELRIPDDYCTHDMLMTAQSIGYDGLYLSLRCTSSEVIILKTFHGSDHFSRVRSGEGDPALPVIFENLPTRPVRCRTPPDSTRGFFFNLLSRPAGRVMTGPGHDRTGS